MRRSVPGSRPVRWVPNANNSVEIQTKLRNSLERVDYVLVFDENRAERVVRTVRPDVLVKGEDYRGRIVDGQKFIESYGGIVALAPLLEGHSTTATVARLRGVGASASVSQPRRARKIADTR